jgi:predicted MFS family arabinose efflux permease
MSITKGYAKYALFVITFANFLSYCDRQIVSALEKELTQAYGLTEVQFGELWTAFTIGYMVFAPIVGYLADHTTRTKILAGCIFLWSLATIASGVAPNKSALLAARFFIGIGEAGCLVIGPALISDFFDKEHRGRALARFFLGLPLGGTAGYLLPARIPDWHFAFFVAGVPGLIVALLVWWMIDPPRGGEETLSHEHIHGIKPYRDLLKNRTLLLIILAQAFAVIIIVPLLHFGVRFFELKHKMTKQEATLSLGLMALAAGFLGTWLSGVLGDKLAKRMRGAYALLAGVAFIFGMPWLLLGFTTSPKWLVLPALTIGAFHYFFCMPAVNTQIANCVTAKQRGMAFALAVFILHLLGDSLAPILFGEASHFLAERVAPMLDIKVPPHVWGRQTAFVIFSFSMALAGTCCLLAFRTAERDEVRAELENQSDNQAPAHA